MRRRKANHLQIKLSNLLTRKSQFKKTSRFPIPRKKTGANLNRLRSKLNPKGPKLMPLLLRTDDHRLPNDRRRHQFANRPSAQLVHSSHRPALNAHGRRSLAEALIRAESLRSTQLKSRLVPTRARAKA
jgi:hypothetical protein